jgi:hypothetical protein
MCAQLMQVRLIIARLMQVCLMCAQLMQLMQEGQ